MSDVYARLAAEVLAGNKIKVLITDKPAPTPAVSFAIKKQGLDGGLMITASHNPPLFNGVKFKTYMAASADRAATEKIESFMGKRLPKLMDFQKALKTGRICLIDPAKGYIHFLRSYVDINVIRKVKPKVLIDYMHGAAAGYLESVLEKPWPGIKALRDNKDALFGGVNPEPIPKNLKLASGYMKKNKFDLCVALDGDGDRIGALKPNGDPLTSGQIISLILLHLLEGRRLRGDVVKTISGTTLIEKICNDYDLTMFETPVGFKYVSALMLKENIMIGGEESGGIGFCGYIPERDGMLSALLLMEMLSYRKKSLKAVMSNMEKRYGRFSYDRLDIRYPFKKAKLLTKRLKSSPPGKIAGRRVARLKTYDGVKFILEDSSWLLLRFSGTEPLIRIYAEAKTKTDVRKLLESGKRIIR